MTRPSPSVTCTNQDISRLPDWAAEGVTLVLDLVRRGQLAPLTERIQIRREGGYQGFDVLLFFIYFFASGLRKGVRTYWDDDARKFSEKLAALGGRKSLPSPSSLSRVLAAVTFEDTRALGPWLLREVTGIENVMRHPSAMTWDAEGQPWHTFDFDPTVHTLRQRALPTGDDLPQAIRRSVEMTPGYSGRKRGDLQLRRATLLHSGCSAWLDMQVAPGNGEDRAELARALDIVAQTVDALEAPRERALFRADGAFGHVPGITAARERKLPFLSRLTRPKLFDQSEVRKKLSEATWLFVPDSRSGPRRSAMDLGMVTLTPGRDVVREDGSPYEPVEARVVVSRYPCSDDSKRGRGRVIGGWRYELFVADGLSLKAWPAHEVVAQYYGRTNEENQFHQEDLELRLDRIFSYHLPGQELATLAGLFVWNLRVARGFELEPPPEKGQQLEPQEAEVDTRVVVEEPAEESVVAPESSSESAYAEHSQEPGGTEAHPLEHALSVALDTFDWQQLLAHRPGWCRPPETTSVQCPQGQTLSITCVYLPKHTPGRSKLIFRSPLGLCSDCVSSADCFPPACSTKAKLLSVSISREEGVAVRAVLGPVQQLRRQRRRKTKKVPSGSPEPKGAVVPPRVFLAVRALPEFEPSSHAVVDPLFLSAAARRIFYQATRGIDVHVSVELPEPAAPQPRLIARSKADRQHRRCTWEQHRDRYALPTTAKVSVRLEGGSALAKIVGDTTITTRCASG